MKILVAEDEPVSQAVLVDALTEWGYDVIISDNGARALAELQREDAPRLAVLDWMMPEMSGPDVCRELRTAGRNAYTYVIILTAKDDKAAMLQSFEVGADDYLSKPFDPLELRARLSSGRRIVTLESELLSSLDQLRENERLHTEFIAALTHDLRTPLVAEQRALEFINDNTGELGSRVALLLQSITHNNSELLELVNNLLDRFYSDEMKIELSKERIHLGDLVSDCFVALDPLAQQKSITLTNRISPAHDALDLDPHCIKRVMMNLLGNALKECPPQSRIDVESNERGNFLEIRVKDNGPGIQPELLPHLFERYYSHSRKAAFGNGLGLNICKTIIELHGGRIQAHSVPGQGACFSFTLPKVPSKPRFSLKKPLDVVIADDLELARLGLKFILDGLPEVNVVGLARDGADALPKVAELKPDLILMDLIMPGMNGIEATRQLKEAHPGLKIVMLTTQGRMQDVHAALAAGADAYCLKDVKTQMLLEAMLAVMNGDRWLHPTIAGFLERRASAEPPLPDHPLEKEAACDSVILAGHPKYQYDTALTDRELQTLRLISKHHSVQEIAEIFYVSPDKVNNYLASAMDKLAVDSYSDAATKALQLRLLKQS
jgi:DNA-binding NarL/FixJ family response regulator